MAFRPKLLTFATVLMALSTPAGAATLAGINAFSCGGQGNGLATTSSRKNWAPETYRGQASYSTSRDSASTVKLRIIYEMGDRIEIDHCGGTVIDRNWVVTAGHCVAADLSWDRIEVIAGDENLDGASRVKRTAREAVCHAGFRYETLENDIALIRLNEPLPARVTPAQLDFEATPSLRPGEFGMGQGWPVTGLRAGDRSLNRTPLHVREIDMRSYITVTNATGGPGGLCRGESGGPLLSEGRYGRRLAGVLSGIQPGSDNGYGEDCMLTGYEMYFTPIAAYRRWIDSVQSVCNGNPVACGAQPRALSYASNAYAAPAIPQYVSHSQTYQPAQPTYQTVAYARPEPTYIDVGPAFGYAAAQPVYNAAPQPYYQPVAPTYVDTGAHYGSMAPVYDDTHASNAASYGGPIQGGYVVAYNTPAVIYGSTFPHHAR